MFTDMRMTGARKAVERRENFQVKARRSVRESLGITYSLRGHDPWECFGHYGPAAMNAGQATQRVWQDVQHRIEKDQARYIVESYHTVIGWVRSDGVWIVANHRYSIATSRHQRMLIDVARMESIQQVS